MIKYKKKFLIIGNQNAISYKEIFELIKANQIWLGYTHSVALLVHPTKLSLSSKSPVISKKPGGNRLMRTYLVNRE